MVHASWIGNVLPACLLICGLLFSQQLLSLLIKPTDANQPIIESAGQCLPLVLMIPMARMFRSAPYGVITGFRQSQDKFHLRQNRNATLINSAAAIASFLVGVGLDYGLEWGAYGYWLCITVSIALSWLGQLYLASQTINHEASQISTPNNPSTEERMEFKLSDSCYSFLSRKTLKSNEDQPLGQLDPLSHPKW